MLLLLPIFVYGLYLGPEVSDFLLMEGGVIETLSAAGYLVCALGIIIKGRSTYIKTHYYFLFLLLLFCARELDFQKRFTTLSVTKISCFTSPSVPMYEKVICVFVFFFIAYIVYCIIFFHFKTFIDGIKKRDVVSIGVLMVFLCLVLSKSFDGAARKLKYIGIEISGWTRFAFSAAEEVLEFGIPVMLMLTFYHYFKMLEFSPLSDPLTEDYMSVTE